MPQPGDDWLFLSEVLREVKVGLDEYDTCHVVHAPADKGLWYLNLISKWRVTFPVSFFCLFSGDFLQWKLQPQRFDGCASIHQRIADSVKSELVEFDLCRMERYIENHSENFAFGP